MERQSRYAGRMPKLLPILFLVALAGCTTRYDPELPRAAAAPPPLPEVFDCLREHGLALVSANRGQAFPDRAENALSSFRETRKLAPILLEIDIARTADGELVLMHDRTLDRTTTGKGEVSAMDFAELRKLQLKDETGRVLDEGVPTLDEALVWAKRNNAILQLDLKEGVDVRRVVEAVRANNMQGQVVLIAYNLAEVRAAMQAAPEMMVSASGANEAENRALLAMAGPRMLFFAGTAVPSDARLAQLRAKGVEPIVGTLGKPGERLDDQWLLDGKGVEYGAEAARGVAVFASDRPVQAWAALLDSQRAGDFCLKEKRQ